MSTTALDSGEWFRQLRPSKLLVLTLLLVVLSSAVAAWLTLSGWDSPFSQQSSDIISALVGINLLILLTIFVRIGRRIAALYRTVKEETGSSRLQRRMVGIFSLVTITPTLIVSIFSAIFFHFGIQTWFDDRVKTALSESISVAEAYLEEHKETIRADIVAVSTDIQQSLSYFIASPKRMQQVLTTQAALRNLTEAVVFTPQQVIARTELSFSLAFERMPPQVMEQVDAGKVVILAEDEDKIRALMRLDELGSTYLMVSRVIDAKVLSHMVNAKGAVSEYERLQKDIGHIQFQFSLLFALIALLLLLAAIWYGLYVAMRLVVPISQLISAADKVRAGDFATKVPTSQKNDEMAILARAFNRMTEQIDKQRSELVTANRLLDERRRVIEAVFSGVSAGVVALSPDLTIVLFNRSAADFLAADDAEALQGTSIQALMPEAADLFSHIKTNPQALSEQTIHLTRGEITRTLHVRMTSEYKEQDVVGYIMTLDDMTELVSAQRSAAWADVARRIAHEIKNPLTPITLSAERLRKKYMPMIAEEKDKEGFEKYLETISRHVKDIGQMVDEFAAFARTPAAVLSSHDLVRTIKESLFSAKTAYPKIVFEEGELPASLTATYDERQIAQTIGNSLKNSAENLEPLLASDPTFKAKVCVSVRSQKQQTDIVIEDNGSGFPPDKIHLLTEPYVTTRAKGTGLGLAIVKKHMEAHKGSILLENKEEGGARVVLSLPHFSTD